ncbi:pimeloyl-ACP methyl ester carboxylesterase [Scopulibacillus darangshiensis]|uniref:Pimeloyl-ACP methyl ester carboxylesterase n=1 Tax=Scopulibacillus darangshiensis TaxID=442528 RepID=A0A4R2PBL8_9BACL|nr:alpha/beta hydrolase [Scopulibacillus darangshiensis]TCP31704.1 pimeloyl-ACP methyl ester carboxylesterase [Scopulibacillus darangshiensis]
MPYQKVNDLTIHYEIEGDGPPLVLLHGMGNNSRSWRKQIETLCHYFTVVAWDAPGYGKSSDPQKPLTEFTDFAKVLRAFLDKLNLHDIYLLGHSMGAATALEFYDFYPDFIKALILADATRGAAACDHEENEKKLKVRLDSIKNLPPNKLAKERVKKLLSPHASDEVRKLAESIMSEARPAGYCSVAYSLYNANQMSLYPMVNIPTLIMCGELDDVTPVSESKIIHSHIQKSEFVTIPNAGHLCYLEDPNIFNYHVINFLCKIEQSKRILERK